MSGVPYNISTIDGQMDYLDTPNYIAAFGDIVVQKVYTDSLYKFVSHLPAYVPQSLYYQPDEADLDVYPEVTQAEAEVPSDE